MNLIIEEGGKVVQSKNACCKSDREWISSSLWPNRFPHWPGNVLNQWLFIPNKAHPESAIVLLQVRYITLLFLCYPVAWIFRYALHPSYTRVATRHVFSAAVGIAMGVMCFGWWGSKGG